MHLKSKVITGRDAEHLQTELNAFLVNFPASYSSEKSNMHKHRLIDIKSFYGDNYFTAIVIYE